MQVESIWGCMQVEEYDEITLELLGAVSALYSLSHHSNNMHVRVCLNNCPLPAYSNVTSNRHHSKSYTLAPTDTLQNSCEPVFPMLIGQITNPNCDRYQCDHSPSQWLITLFFLFKLHKSYLSTRFYTSPMAHSRWYPNRVDWYNTFAYWLSLGILRRQLGYAFHGKYYLIVRVNTFFQTLVFFRIAGVNVEIKWRIFIHETSWHSSQF